ncbi:hypothetical protein ACQJBY_068819 [Aegilops geniculata]
MAPPTPCRSSPLPRLPEATKQTHPAASPPRLRWGPKGPNLGRAGAARPRRQRRHRRPEVRPCSRQEPPPPRWTVAVEKHHPGSPRPAPVDTREGKGQGAVATSVARARPAVGTGDGGREEGGGRVARGRRLDATGRPRGRRGRERGKGWVPQDY